MRRSTGALELVPVPSLPSGTGCWVFFIFIFFLFFENLVNQSPQVLVQTAHRA